MLGIKEVVLIFATLATAKGENVSKTIWSLTVEKVIFFFIFFKLFTQLK